MKIKGAFTILIILLVKTVGYNADFEILKNFQQPVKEITLLSAVDNKPIKGVVVRGKSNPTLVGISDAQGKVNISQFEEDETLVINHLGYAVTTILIEQILSQGGTVFLEESILSLEEVVLSANKWEQEKKHIPNQITAIRAKDIAFKNPQTTADLLQQTGQVFIQKSQQGGGSPMIRGFSANSILIVIDGVRMNNAIYRSGNLQNVISLDANILGGAEVVFGPGSVMYGSDALGGVMDFHTRNPEYNNEEKLLLEGSFMGRYASANNELTGHLDLNVAGKKWALLTSFTHSDFSDLRSGANRPATYPEFGKRLTYISRIEGEDEVIENNDPNIQKFSGYSQLNLLNKLSFKANDHLAFTYSLHHSATSNVPRYDRLIERRDGNLRNAEWYYAPQSWQLHALKTDINYKTHLFDRVKNTFAFQNVQEGRNDRRFASSTLRRRIEKVNVYSWNLDAEKTFANKKFELFYGTEVVHNTVDSEANTINIDTEEIGNTSTRYPDGSSTVTSVALYSSAKYLLSEKITITSGLRYSYVSLDANFVDKSFFPFPYDEVSLTTGALNGNLGFTFRPNNKTQINFNLSNGFRAPNIDDVGKLFDSEPGNVVVPNPDLKPENSYNIEGGISRLLFSDRLKVDFTIFYSRLTDAMVRRPFLFNQQDSILYDGTLSQV
ncbi:MAG: TonB-dependent receptor, partial [Bacteroidota bacterium]